DRSPASGFSRPARGSTAVRKKGSPGAYDDRVRPLLRDCSEYAPILGRCRLLERHIDHRDLQSSTSFPKLLSIGTFPLRAHRQECGLGCRWGGFLEDLEALPPDLDPRVERDAGDIASRARQARREPGQDRIAPHPNDRYRAGIGADRLRDRVRNGDDYLRVPLDDLASEIGVALG